MAVLRVSRATAGACVCSAMRASAAVSAVIAGSSILVSVLAAPTGAPEHSSAGRVALSVSGEQLAINRQPRFLLGVSLFDALGSTPPSDSDLDQLARWGIDLVRVWAHWNEPVYDATGSLTPRGRERLVNLVTRLDAREMGLVLVILRPGQLEGQRFALFSTAAARLRAVREVTALLTPYRSVILDLCNEHDHPDGPLTVGEARQLRDAVKVLDPARIVTMSFTSANLLESDGAVGPAGRGILRAQVGSGQGSASVDVLTPHLPRTADWARVTAPRVTALRRALQLMGRPVPVLLDEEKRTEAGGPAIPAEEFLSAAAGARDAGAAGWFLHTAAGFDLRARGFVETLDTDERIALSALRTRLGYRQPSSLPSAAADVAPRMVNRSWWTPGPMYVLRCAVDGRRAAGSTHGAADVCGWAE